MVVKSIFLCQSGTNEGSLILPHAQRFHFVIGNGSATADGFIEHNTKAEAGPDMYICFIGNFNGYRPTRLQLKNSTFLIRQLMSKHGLTTDDVRRLRGHPEHRVNLGHKFDVERFVNFICSIRPFTRQDLMTQMRVRVREMEYLLTKLERLGAEPDQPTLVAQLEEQP